MRHARLRKEANARQTFSPEAFGKFDIVAPEKIAALRARMEERMSGHEWETIEDVVDLADA